MAAERLKGSASRTFGDHEKSRPQKWIEQRPLSRTPNPTRGVSALDPTSQFVALASLI